MSTRDHQRTIVRSRLLRPSLFTGLATLALFGLACSSSEETGAVDPSATGSTNVAQGGPQDIAQFRAIVEAGGVPEPELLDPVGFFAEHALDLPPADCGLDVCVHGALSVMPRFDESNWTMAFFAMNTPVDPSTLPRPPLHLVLALERTADTAPFASAIQGGLMQLMGELRPEDRVSVVAFGDVVDVLGEALPAGDPALMAAVAPATLSQSGSNLYGALSEADRLLDAHEGELGARRVLLVTSGRADVGVTDPERVVALGEALVAEGTALGVVGMGAGYDATIPQELGSLGAGTYSFAADAQDVDEILRAEGETTLFPLAREFELTIEPGPGYRVGNVYGVKRAVRDGERVRLVMPALFIGQRDGAADVGGGRRGGGGGIFVELRAEGEGGAEGSDAFTYEASWLDPVTLEPVGEARAVANALAPGENPAGMWPHFSDETQGKAFMMLNLYLALRATTTLYDAGDCARSLGLVDMFRPSIEGWLGTFYDVDLDQDHKLLEKLRENVRAACETTSPVAPVEPRDFEGGCGFL